MCRRIGVDVPDQDRPCQRGDLGGPPDRPRHAPLPLWLLVPALQAPGHGARRLRAQTDCGQPESGATSGLVAYLDGESVGWCAVEPRTAYVRLGRVPWAGRAEDKTDDSSGS